MSQVKPQAESESASRFSPLLLLRWMLRLLFWLTSGFVLLLLLIIYRPPALLLEGLSHLISWIVYQQTALPLKIGAIQQLELRLGYQRLEVTDIHLYGYKGAREPFAVIPRLSFESDLVSFLRGFEQVALLELDYPLLNVIRDAQGKINLRPQLKPSDPNAPETPFPDLPRIKVAVNHLLTAYRDLGEQLPLKEQVAVPMVRGDLYDGQTLAAYAKVRDPLAVFWGHGQANLETGKGWASADVNTPDLIEANRYVSLFSKQVKPLEELRFLQGNLAGQLWANWDTWAMENLRYTLKLAFDDVQAYVPYYADRVVLNGKAELNEKRTWIPGLTLETEGSLLQAQGTVDEYYKKPLLNLHLQSPGLRIGQILPAIKLPELKPIVRDFAPQGSLLADVKVQGLVERLSASGQVQLPYFQVRQGFVRQARADFNYRPDYLSAHVTLAGAQYEQARVADASSELVYQGKRLLAKARVGSASYQDAWLRQARADVVYLPDHAQARVQVASGGYQEIDAYGLNSFVDYTPERVSVPHLQAQVFEGQVFSQAQIQLKGAQRLQASLRGYGLSLQDLQQDLNLKLPPDYRSAGLVGLNVQAGGTLSNPVATGSLSSHQISFPQGELLNPIEQLEARFSYSKALSQLALRAHSRDAGQIKAAATLRQLDQLAAKLEAEQIALNKVNRFSGRSLVEEGSARLSAHMLGSIRQLQRNWMAFTGAADFQAKNLKLQLPQGESSVEQELQKADLKLAWQRGLMDIQKLDIQNPNSYLKGQGRVSVPLLLSQQRLQDAFRGNIQGDLDLEEFPILQAYDIYDGQVKLALNAQETSGQGVKVSLTSEGSDIQLQDTLLDRFELDSSFKDQRITLNKARLVESGDEIKAWGTIDLKSQGPPVLDLKAQAEDFQLEHVVALIPAQIRQQIEPKIDPKAWPEPDKLPDRYTLPNIATRKNFQLDSEIEPDGKIPEPAVNLRWQEVYDHWKRWNYPPSTRVVNAQKAKPGLLESVKGELSLDAHIKGVANNPAVNLQGLVQQFEVQDSKISKIYLDAAFENKLLSLDELSVLDPKGGSLTAQGQIDLDNDLNLEIKGQGVGLELAEPFLPDRNMRLNGKLNFLAIAEGKTRSPQVTAEMQLDRLLFNRIFFDNLQAFGDYQDGYVRDTRLEVNYSEQQVVANGDVPVTDLSKPMDVTLQLQDDSFGLLNLFTQVIDWRKGQGALLVHVVGSPRSPELEGSLSLDNTDIYIPMLKESLQNLKVRAELVRKQEQKTGYVDQSVAIKTAEARFGGGNVSVDGEMGIENLLPSYFELVTRLENVTLNYTQPGLFETRTPITLGTIQLRGEIYQPGISGKIFLGRDGEIFFPFLRDRQDIPTSTDFETDDDAVAESKRSFEFKGLNIYIPYEYKVTSALFDIPAISKDGLKLSNPLNKQRDGRYLAIDGQINAERGTLYLLNNVLNVDTLNIKFNPEDENLNPQFAVETSFNVEGADQPVVANISGTLEDVKSNNLDFAFSNTQGLSETQILGQLSGFKAVEGIGRGDISGVAYQFSDVVLRGLFDPLTSRISSLLGLEELSFGVAGQSINGPEFKFTVRSSPFFMLDELVERELQALSFLDNVHLRATGYLKDPPVYELGANYDLNEYWSLDYKYEQLGSVHHVRVNSDYLLDTVLRWMDEFRRQYFGWEGPAEPADKKAETQN